MSIQPPVTSSSPDPKPGPIRPTRASLIAKLMPAVAALTLGVVLVFAGLRELGLWFSLPAANCHGLCDWTKTSGPTCPLIAVAVGGAIFGLGLALVVKRVPDEEGD